MALFPGYDLYGGATITRFVDGGGFEWVGCCAKKVSTAVFGFYVFRNGVEMPLSPFCTGRGSINGGGQWVAWQGVAFFYGALPGWVPYPAAGAGPQGPQGVPGPPGATGAQGPQGLPGTGGDAALSASDREALDRLKAWLGVA